MDKKLVKLLLRMHKANGVLFDLLKTANALQGVKTAEFVIEHSKIENELQNMEFRSILNSGYPNVKEAALLMVEKREFEQRCLNVNLCPECGKDLGRDQYEKSKICRHCNLDFPHLQ